MDFNDAYELLVTREQDDGRVRELFDPKTIVWLAEHPLRPHFEFRAGFLCVYVPGFSRTSAGWCGCSRRPSASRAACGRRSPRPPPPRADAPLRFMMPGVLTFGVLIFALSKAATTTIVNLVIWGVVFPALVTGLIALAVIRAIGERQENEENRRHRRRA